MMGGVAAFNPKEKPMRGFVMASGLAATLMLAGLGPTTVVAQGDKVYDLRGPAPEKGQVFLSEMKLTIKNADTTVKSSPL